MISFQVRIIFGNGKQLAQCGCDGSLCFLIFALMHWPCSTTLMTIKKETGSLKWTLVSLLTPALMGGALCMLVNLLFYITSL